MPEQFRIAFVLRTAIIAITLCLSCGCAPRIRVDGYGNRPPVQHGLKVELLHRQDDGAILRITNVSDGIVSVNQSPQAMEVHILKDGKPAAPCGQLIMHWTLAPQPDDFVILGPGQTRDVVVPASVNANRYTAIDRLYKFDKGVLYFVDVQLNPYFGHLTSETANEMLGQFKIPNYLHEPIRTNTMILRAR